MNHNTLGREFIQALNDFERKGNVNIRTSGAPMAHPSIIVDRNDDNIVIVSPTTIHMSHRQLVQMDEKLNKAGKYSWLMLKAYVSIINDPAYSKRIHQLNAEQSKTFLFEFFHRMMVIIDEGYYDTDDIHEVFRAMYNAFGSKEDLDNMMKEVILDILDDQPTLPNVCRTCKFCSNLGTTCGYGQCSICTFVPSKGETTTISDFQSEYGKHIYSKGGVIYTDITTGQHHCDDYYPRPISGMDTLKAWIMT